MNELKQRLPLKFHLKKVGQLQFYFSAPRMDGNQLKEGAIYLEGARPVEGGDGNTMDWQNKIIMKLNAAELSEIIVRVRKGMPVDLVHKHNDMTSSLKIEAGQTNQGLQSFAFTLNKGGKFVTVYLKETDLHILFNCFESVQPALLGWVWRDTVRLAVETLSAPQQSETPHYQHEEPQGYGYRQ